MLYRLTSALRTLLSQFATLYSGISFTSCTLTCVRLKQFFYCYLISCFFFFLFWLPHLICLYVFQITCLQLLLRGTIFCLYVFILPCADPHTIRVLLSETMEKYVSFEWQRLYGRAIRAGQPHWNRIHLLHLCFNLGKPSLPFVPGVIFSL